MYRVLIKRRSIYSFIYRIERDLSEVQFRVKMCQMSLKEELDHLLIKIFLD
jgi:hypothetical protein